MSHFGKWLTLEIDSLRKRTHFENKSLWKTAFFAIDHFENKSLRRLNHSLRKSLNKENDALRNR